MHPFHSQFPSLSFFLAKCALQMRDAACLGLGTTHPADRTRILQNLFPGGTLKADCVGLQCIGFNHGLYDALRRRFQAPECGSKGKMDEMGSQETGSRAKRRGGSYN